MADEPNAKQNSAKPESSNGTQKGGKQIQRPKGSLPPKISLREATDIITALYERAGGDASLDEVSAIMGNSRGSSTFQIKLGLLKNYGLITTEGDKVRLSETGHSIVAPKEQAERNAGLKKAFTSNEVFKTIYEKYIGRLLPQDEFLKNSFVELIPKDLADKWMEQFKDSALCAGLLMDRGDGKYQVRETASATTKEVTVNEIVPISETTSFERTPEPAVRSLATDKTPYQFLIEILAADMSEPEQQAVWTLIQYLKKKEAGKVKPSFVTEQGSDE
jgi:hypothetical protein